MPCIDGKMLRDATVGESAINISNAPVESYFLRYAGGVLVWVALTGTPNNTFTIDDDSVLGKFIFDVTLGAVDRSMTFTNVALTDNRVITVKDESGTIALLSDLTAHLSAFNHPDIATNTTHRGLTNNPHSTTKTHVGLGNVTNILNKLDATVAPTINEDSGDGYSVGSLWCDVTADKAYQCLDAAVGAAVWIEITQSGGGSIIWGDITGTLSNQTDLQSALDGKSGTAHVHTHASTTGKTATDHHSNTNDPTADQKGALAGTNGTPSATNKFVTNTDPRNTDARTPVAHNQAANTITDFAAAVTAHADVTANTAARHTRGHSVTDASDHAASAAGDKGKYLRAEPTTGAIEFIVPPFVANSSGEVAIGLEIKSTDAGAAGAVLELKHDSASPFANDILGEINFTGNNSTPAPVTFGKLIITSKVVTAGSEQQKLVIQQMVNGTLTTVFTIDGNAVTIDGDLDIVTGILQVDGIQILTSQQLAIGDVAVAGAAEDGTCRSKLNDILAMLRAHGLIAP